MQAYRCGQSLRRWAYLTVGTGIALIGAGAIVAAVGDRGFGRNDGNRRDGVNTNSTTANDGRNPVDLVFMEIDLPTESGIDFWQSIRQHGTGNTESGQLPMAISTTASSDYALTSYDLKAIDYLLKPFAFGRYGQPH